MYGDKASMAFKYEEDRMNKRIRRVCLLAGPNSGKSKLASFVFSHERMFDKNLEHVSEYIKGWAYIGQKPMGFDQVYIFGKQLHKEEIVLRSNEKSVVVTESPLLLSACYARRYGAMGCAHLMDVIREFDEEYPPFNILIDRTGIPYNPIGRFQTEDQASEMHDYIKAFLDKEGQEYHIVKYNDREGLVELVERNI